MEPVEQVQANAAPEIMLSTDQQTETKQLLGIVDEQVSIMGREETRDMLAFMLGVKFARAMNAVLPPGA